jgi:hypothetical protein
MDEETKSHVEPAVSVPEEPQPAPEIEIAEQVEDVASAGPAIEDQDLESGAADEEDHEQPPQRVEEEDIAEPVDEELATELAEPAEEELATDTAEPADEELVTDIAEPAEEELVTEVAAEEEVHDTESATEENIESGSESECESESDADDIMSDHEDHSEMASDTEQQTHTDVELDEHADDSQIGDDSIVLPSIEDDAAHDAEEHATSNSSSRRTTSRTEALIQAAARDIIAQIEIQQNGRCEVHHDDEEHTDEPFVSSHPDDASYVQEYDEGDMSVIRNEEEDEEETVADEHEALAADAADEAGGDSSSQHDGTDEEVFSDKSPRSSIGSYDGSSESGKQTQVPDNITVTSRSTRVSDISQYDEDKEESFIPTARGVPRPPFRTPSDVRALQMSSPAPSVLGSVVGSPRSNKRPPFPTVSRLGSPGPSVQYSPKNRTPTRFKTNEAPLVLLHVTLLPLRWMWGDEINAFDASEMSEEGRAVRDAWRMLQDRMGDTVLERGILLGHPQNDYEVLEERLLEALDLPMRRRARILECGHYLGLANENNVGEDSESEDDYDTRFHSEKRHWCNTCKCDIRFDSLGPGKIFRVKVYASNGLMRAGAWEACWKEMERVDIELEPVIEPAVNEELIRLEAARRDREEAAHQQIMLASEAYQPHEEEQADLGLTELETPPALPSAPRTERRSASAERIYQQEERLREIYGLAPDPEGEAGDPPIHDNSYIPSPSPPSPSEEAYERRESRRQALQSASLPELAWRAVQVLLQDRKNVVIAALGVFAILMALRQPPPPQLEPVGYEINNTAAAQQIPVVEVPKAVVEEEEQQQQSPPADSGVDCVTVTQTVVPRPSVHRKQQHSDAELVPARQAPAEDTVTQRKTIRMVQTITETETLKIETVTEIETTKVKATVTMTDRAHAWDGKRKEIGGSGAAGLIDSPPPPPEESDALVLGYRNHDEI